MADQRISVQYPPLPNEEAGEFLAPTRAEFLQLMADACNHFTGFKFLPCGHYHAGWAGDVYRTKTFARDDVHRVPIEPLPLSTDSYIVLVIHYQAGELAESASDFTDALNGWSIEATLRDYGTGVAVDGTPAVVWSVANGTLETVVEVDNFQLVNPGEVVVSGRYPTLMATTGMIVEAAPANPTGPRPLIIPDTQGGAELLVELETVNVRILSVDAWQMWVEAFEE